MSISKNIATEIPDAYWQAFGIPLPEREYRFHNTRRFRFDFAWPRVLLACEIEGGLYIDGRHTRGAGYEADLEKYNEATFLGWSILRYPPSKINFETIRQLYFKRRNSFHE